MSEPLLIACIISGVCLLFAWVIIPAGLRWRGIYYKRHTKAGPALVFDSADDDGTAVRLLNVGGTFQSVSYIDAPLRWELVCAYHRSCAEVIERAGLFEDASTNTRALVMGGGGYSLPKWIVSHRGAAEVTAVEIDPAITQLARQFFFLDEFEREFADGRLALIEGDAWHYLLEQTEPYALIVNDAFSGKRPLGPMKTAEGAHIIHEHLTPDGIYLANVISRLDGRHRTTLDRTFTTFQHEFAHVWLIYERPEEPSRSGNNVLVASDRDLTIDDIAQVCLSKKRHTFSN